MIIQSTFPYLVRKLDKAPTRIYMKITEKFIRENSTNGETGWTKKQMHLLGLNYPPGKGWINSRIGKVMRDADAMEFIKIGEKQRSTYKGKVKIYTPKVKEATTGDVSEYEVVSISLTPERFTELLHIYLQEGLELVTTTCGTDGMYRGSIFKRVRK